jgi:hypothetical protein
LRRRAGEHAPHAARSVSITSRPDYFDYCYASATEFFDEDEDEDVQQLDLSLDCGLSTCSSASSVQNYFQVHDGYLEFWKLSEC